MIPQNLLTLEEQLRRAIATQQFGDAGLLLTQYCESAKSFIHSLPAGSDAAREVVIRVGEVLDWSNLMLLSARAAIADQLAPLPLISRYLTPDNRRERQGIQA